MGTRAALGLALAVLAPGTIDAAGATAPAEATPAEARVSASRDRDVVRLGLAPSAVRVAPGEEFVLELRVLRPGPRFNGYDAVVEWDREALALAPGSDDRHREGTSMWRACENTFLRFRPDADSAVVNHVLMCAGAAVRGPGDLYVLRFRAGKHSGATSVRIRRAVCYEAGLQIRSATEGESSVVITEPKQTEKTMSPSAAGAVQPMRGEP
jgi:hypothetical protein